jgi:hypothetical protein
MLFHRHYHLLMQGIRLPLSYPSDELESHIPCLRNRLLFCIVVVLVKVVDGLFCLFDDFLFLLMRDFLSALDLQIPFLAPLPDVKQPSWDIPDHFGLIFLHGWYGHRRRNSKSILHRQMGAWEHSLVSIAGKEDSNSCTSSSDCQQYKKRHQTLSSAKERWFALSGGCTGPSGLKEVGVVT